MMSKSAWLLSAALVAVATPAYAQDTSQEPEGTQPSATEQGAVEPEGQAAADQLVIYSDPRASRYEVFSEVELTRRAAEGGERQVRAAATSRRTSGNRG